MKMKRSSAVVHTCDIEWNGMDGRQQPIAVQKAFNLANISLKPKIIDGNAWKSNRSRILSYQHVFPHLVHCFQCVGSQHAHRGAQRKRHSPQAAQPRRIVWKKKHVRFDMFNRHTFLLSYISPFIDYWVCVRRVCSFTQWANLCSIIFIKNVFFCII